VPLGLPDVVMEGVRLMGASATLFLAAKEPNGIVSTVEKISALGCAGAIRSDFRAVTLVAMEQFTQLTFILLGTNARIDFACDSLRNAVENLAKMFLNVPDAPLVSTHSSYLAPYYSLTKVGTLGTWLTNLCNSLIESKSDDKNAEVIVSNIETWARELYRTQKSLLLISIEGKSSFAFDLVHWITHVTKLLDAVAYAPVTDNSTRESIEKHATWLLSVISWIPEQKETILFVENFSMTDTLFELARDTLLRNNGVVAERAREILVDWVFAAGRYSWGRLEHGLEALAALALSKEEAQLGTWLEAKIARKLKPDEPFDSDLLDQTARNLRRLAVSFHPREFETNSVKRAMAEVDPTKLRQLLTAIADMLSPRTKDERLARKLDGV
jgi:hypothetical protein